MFGPIEAGSKRGVLLLSEPKIAAVMAFQCNCIPQCADAWTRKAVRNARKAYLTLPLNEQLKRVYEILHAHFNEDTMDATLMVCGKLSSHNSFIFQAVRFAVKHF